ncbi:MAG: hypothetical protein G01um101470_968 [Parcubacteria group bacterium Gr01-1014_70]|nr:MAG: hypothetical protein G01um101470_968 [Parcubacteria group bacterium Gr01-1014_70]
MLWYLGSGAYGVTANTGACGALDKGSTPFRHPKIRSEATIFLECARMGAPIVESNLKSPYVVGIFWF